MLIQPVQERRPRGAAVLDPERTRAIWKAALLELARVGYDRLSMDAVARRANVGKAALYRRWNGKEAMVIALISAVEIEIVTPCDQGSLEADVRDYLKQAYRLLRRPLVARILPEFYAEVSRDTELAEAIRSTVIKRKRDSISALLERARRRGELARPVDLQLAFDLIVGPIYWRAVISRAPVSKADLDDAAGRVTAALMR